eukprot:3025763-Amphidinium_carterae.1
MFSSSPAGCPGPGIPNMGENYVVVLLARKFGMDHYGEESRKPNPCGSDLQGHNQDRCTVPTTSFSTHQRQTF